MPTRDSIDRKAAVNRLQDLNKKGMLDRAGTVIKQLKPADLSRYFREASMPGDLQNLYEVYEKIEAYDGKIKGLIEKRRKAPTRFPTKFRITDESHPKADQVQAFIEDSMKDLDIKSLMRRTMDGIIHGVQLMENVWFQSTDGNIYPKDPIPISTSRYGQNNSGRSNRLSDPDWGKLFIRTGYTPDSRIYVEDISNEKIFKAVYNEKRGYYDLAGVMRPLCKWYIFKYFAAQYWIEYDETYGFPTTIVNVPKSDLGEFEDKIKEFLEDVGRNKFGILFESMEYEVHQQQQTGQSRVFKELIDLANSEIIYAVTGQNLTESGTQGSYAESLVGYDMETNLVIDDAEFVDEMINKNLIEPLIQFNFADAPKDLVKFHTDTPKRKDWSRITKKWELAAKIGLKGVSKSQLEEELDIKFAEGASDSVDLTWRQYNTGGEQPPANQRERDDGGSQAEDNEE